MKKKKKINMNMNKLLHFNIRINLTKVINIGKYIPGIIAKCMILGIMFKISAKLMEKKFI